MAPSVISEPPTGAAKIKAKSTSTPTVDALEAARARFVDRNVESLKLHNEAIKSMPGGNTRSLLYTAPFPVFMKSGKNHQVFSEDGHIYTDFVGELTAGLYGHSQPLIHKTLRDTLTNVGLSLGATTRLEAQHAALLCSRFNLDLVRFTNSGTEANLHAIQGARRYTGKRKIVVCTGGYHGGCFGFTGPKPEENNVDKDEFIIAEYNNLADVKKKIEQSGDVAAVLAEGMQGSGPAIVGTHAFLHQIQESARKVGAVFILDEVMTSRIAPGGLQELEGLRPDITSFGKYLGGGITFGAFGGREEVMRVYDPRDSAALGHSGTFNNNVLGMAAGYVGLSQVYTPDVSREFNHIGERLRDDLQAISKGTKMTVTGRGTIIGIHFLKDGRKELASAGERLDDLELKELFWLEAMEEGYWITKRGMIALILGTPAAELERFVKVVDAFLRRHESLVRL